MANSTEYDVIINVITGHLEKATKELKGMAGEVDNVAKANKRAAASGKEHNDVMNGGVASANNGTRGFAKLKEAINGSNGLVAAYATLATNAFAIGAAFSKLKEARGVELIMQGLAETSARTGTELTTVASRMKEVTGQAVDMASAMKYTAQLSSAGISTKDIERLTQAATAAAYHLGREVPDAIQRMTLAVAKNEPELVDELGMTMKSTEAWRQYGLTIGKTAVQLTDQEKKLALLNGWIKQTTDAYGNLSDAVDVNEFSQLSASFDELIRSGVQGVSSFLRVGEGIKYLSSSTLGLTSVITIFLSTISKQLIPGLYNLDKASLTRRNSIEKEIRLQKEQIIFAGKAAKAQNNALIKANVESLSNLGSDLKNARGAEVKVPAAYKEYLEAEKQGVATANQREAAIQTLKRSQSQYNRFVDQESEAYKTASVVQREAAAKIIATRQQQIALIRETIALKAEEAALDLTNAKKITGMQRQNVGSRMQGFALGKQASAIEEMGTGSMGVGLKEGRTAIAAYSRGMENAVKASEELGTKIPFVTKGLAGLRTGLFAVETGVKMLSSGLLRIIPYVGWAMLAWDLFGDHIMKFFGKVFDTSNVQKAAKDLETVAKNATNVVTKAQNTQNNISSSAHEVVKSIIAEKNAIEQAHAALIKYNNEKAKEEADKNNPNKGLSPREIELKNLNKDLGDRRREQYNARDEASKNRAKALADELDALKDAKEAVDKLNDSYKIGLTDKDVADKTSIINKLYGNITKGTIDAMNQGRFIPTVSKDTIQEMQILKSIFATSKGPEYFNNLIKSQKDWDKLDHAGKMKLLEGVMAQVDTETRKVGEATQELTNNTSKAKDSFQTFLQTLKPKTAFDDSVESLEKVNTSLLKVKAVMLESSWKNNKFIGVPDPAAVTKYEESVISTAQDMNEYLTSGTREQLDGLEKQKQAVISIANERAKLNKDDKDYAANNAALAAKQNTEYQKYLDIRTATVSSVTKELKERETLLETARAEGITQQALLALAQARLQVLQRHGIVTAEDYMKQVAAENNIKNTQIASLDIQKKILGFKYDDLKADAVKLKNALNLALINENEIKQNQIKSQQLLYQQAITEKNIDAQNKALEALKQLTSPDYHTPETVNLQAQYQDALNALKPYGLEMQAINLQQKAIRETIVSTGEAQIEAQRYSLQLQDKINALDLKQKSTVLETNKIRAQSTQIIARTIPLYTNLINAEQQAQSELNNLTNDYASQYADNQINLQKAQFNHNQSQIRDYTIIGNLILANFRAETERVRVQLDLNRLQELYVDVLGNGLEMQQKALEPMQKALEIQSSLIDQRKQLRQLDAQIAAKAMGTEITPEQQRRLDILSAKEALQNARQQLAIKIEGIRLEYALLEAQRIQSQLALKARRQELAYELSRAHPDGNLNSQEVLMLQQMDNAISGLSVSYERIMDSAILQAQNELKIREKELKLLETAPSTIGEGIIADVLRAVSAIEQIKKTEQEIKSTDATEASSYIKTVKAATADSKTAQQMLTEAIIDYTPKQIISMDALTKAMTTEATRRTTPNLGVNPNTKGIMTGRMISEKPTDINMKSDAWKKPVSEELVQFTRFLQARVPDAIITSFNAGKHNGPDHNAADIRSRNQADVKAIQDAAVEFKKLTGIIIKVTPELIHPEKQRVWSGPHTHTALEGVERTSVFNPPTAYQTPGIGDGVARSRIGSDFLDGIKIEDYPNFDKFGEPLQTAATAQEAASGKLNQASDKFLTAADSIITVLASKSPQMPEVDTQGMSSSVISAFTGGELGRGKDAAGNEGKGAITSIGGRDLNSGAAKKLNDIDTEMTASMKTLSDKLKSELFSDGITGPEFDTAMTTFQEKMGAGFALAKQRAQEQMKDALPMTDLSNQVSAFWNDADTAAKPFLDSLKTLGPDGELVASVYSGIENMSKGITQFASVLESGKAGISDYASLAGSILSSVGNIFAASSKSKIANIDKEIAAEQKRDGKSAESVAKIAQLQKKKEAEEKKAFDRDKKIKMAETVIATAAAVMKAAPNVGKMVLMGALGAAQLAIIASSSYQGSSTTDTTVNMPSTLSIGKRSDTVDLAKGPNANAGGEVGYLRGSEGTGSNASNYRTVGSAYGGDLTRGYGNRGFVVGEKGPEIISPDTPINVTPANDISNASPINANISIHAIDSQGVQDVLVAQKGNIIKMLRQAANASGKTFMEDVNVNVYTRPSVNKL